MFIQPGGRAGRGRRPGALPLLSRVRPVGVSSFSFLPPQSYTHLLLLGIGRASAGASPGVNLRFTFNGDGGNNYEFHTQQLANATNASSSLGATSSIEFALVPWSGAVADYNGGVRMEILDYRNTEAFKRFLGQMSTSGASALGASWISRYGTGVWRSKQPIERIDVSLNGANFVTPSIYELYGYN